MTHSDEDRPDLEEAAARTRKSAHQADRDLAQAREESSVWMQIARKLQQLREDNGFEEIFKDAFGRSGG